MKKFLSFLFKKQISEYHQKCGNYGENFLRWGQIKDSPLKLNNGLSIPQLGLGTWLSQEGKVVEAVTDAIDAGYRHIDTAYGYQNEKEIGQAIREKIDKGVVKREDLFITSKLWNSYHPKEMVVPVLRKQLKSLGLDYLDLYLIHWPYAFKEGDAIFPKTDDGKLAFSDVDYVETWQGMEEALSLGLTKSIGISNFNSEQIKRVMAAAKVKPVMNQVESHPYMNQNKLIEFCKTKDIAITAYSPLGNPMRPGAKAGEKLILEDKDLKAIAEKHKKTLAQVAIKWQLQRGVVVIPKSVTKSRIIENFDIFDFTLTEDEMKTIDNLDCNHRYLIKEDMMDHKFYPFKIEF